MHHPTAYTVYGDSAGACPRQDRVQSRGTCQALTKMTPFEMWHEAWQGGNQIGNICICRKIRKHKRGWGGASHCMVILVWRKNDRYRKKRNQVSLKDLILPFKDDVSLSNRLANWAIHLWIFFFLSFQLSNIFFIAMVNINMMGLRCLGVCNAVLECIGMTELTVWSWPLTKMFKLGHW